MTTITAASTQNLERVPGLYRRWELIYLLEPGEIYRIEDAGRTSDGVALLAVYRRVRDEPMASPPTRGLQ